MHRYFIFFAVYSSFCFGQKTSFEGVLYDSIINNKSDVTLLKKISKRLKGTNEDLYCLANMYSSRYSDEYLKSNNYTRFLRLKYKDNPIINFEFGIEELRNYFLFHPNFSQKENIERLFDELEYILLTQKISLDNKFLYYCLKYRLLFHYDYFDESEPELIKQLYEKTWFYFEKLDNIDLKRMYLPILIFESTYIDGTKEELNEFIDKIDFYSRELSFSKKNYYTSISILCFKSRDYKRAIENNIKAIKEFSVVNTDYLITDYIKEVSKVSNDNLKMTFSYFFNHVFFLLKNAIENGEDQDFNKAFQYAMAMDYLLDKRYLLNLNTRNKSFWRKLAAERYFIGTFASFYVNKPETMHYFMEKNRNLLLLDHIQAKQEQAKIPDSLIQANKALKAKVFDLETLVDQGKKLPDSTHLRYLRLREQLNTQEDSLQIAYPGFKPLSIPKLLSIAEVQERLRENEVSVSYIWDMDEDDFDDAFGLVISKTETKIIHIKGIARLGNLVEVFRKRAQTPFENTADQTAFYQVANDLYSTLFPEDVQEMIQGKKLIIVPDSDLQSIPFEALVTDVAQKRYLIQDASISYANSLTYLYRNRDQGPTSEFLNAYAPVHFAKDSLATLHKTKAEIETITNKYSGTTYIENSATRVHFEEKIEQSTILHLATHAQATTIDPWVQFADEKLYLHDLYTMDTNAQMVCLSACETAAGTIEDGEGTMSLARGFFHAGAASVLSSLWTINDSSTKDIMCSFYANAEQGNNKAAALQKAKLSYLEASGATKEAAPYYWAPFVLIGNTDALVFPSFWEKNGWGIALLVFGLLLFGGLFFFWREKVQKKHKQ